MAEEEGTGGDRVALFCEKEPQCSTTECRNECQKEEIDYKVRLGQPKFWKSSDPFLERPKRMVHNK